MPCSNRRKYCPRSWFDQAEDYFRRQGGGGAIVALDRCEVLLSVRLAVEAREAAEAAVSLLARGKMATDLAEARLALSQAALLEGDATGARAIAEQARRAFVRQGRSTWAALAWHASLRAAWAQGRRSPGLVDSAQRAAVALANSGFGAISVCNHLATRHYVTS